MTKDGRALDVEDIGKLRGRGISRSPMPELLRADLNSIIARPEDVVVAYIAFKLNPRTQTNVAAAAKS
jgi:hypothetical protein